MAAYFVRLEQLCESQLLADAAGLTDPSSPSHTPLASQDAREAVIDLTEAQLQ